MDSEASQQTTQARSLRAWQLALLRFAVTLEASDRQAAAAIAAEIDRLGLQDRRNPSAFSFFRKITQELCEALLQPDAAGEAIIRCHLGRMPDGRLKRAFRAAVAPPPAADVEKVGAAGPAGDLWKGLAAGKRASR